MELNLGFFASHDGSNVEAILDAINHQRLDARPKVIISNNPGVRVFKVAYAEGIPAVCINRKQYEDVDNKILEVLHQYNVNLIVLAGYGKKLGEKVLNSYFNRALNIHPSLLPRYGGNGKYGMAVHEEVIKSGDQESGATVHLVDGEYDRGRILSQYRVPIDDGDTPETLAERVLKTEHAIYPQVLIDIQKERINLDSF